VHVVVNVQKRCISGSKRQENDVNTANRYSTETARHGAVFRSGAIRYVIWNDGLRPKIGEKWRKTALVFRRFRRSE
jgi:hypothetical protein